ncbi:MAG: hypothetical protein A9Z00_13090 [Thermobacillus sp. ZCTH02-B1]|uniref:efflux RND transporter permease subunit n=1 Tax=Thermobacillus sp. ZCTH02-B1 TaxID=1858795 RepID=UPI000B549E1C|nr:efflux RND transporter permease subunit [Thermobacillus sp. ZCTH02-B1]OUM97351.1 MAG: hypothetical protein A9Z00_13090 [Thermobacillus sp. ZCTH02-B1]
MLRNLTEFSLRNPMAIVLLVVLVAVGGIYSIAGFRQEQLPDIDIPGIAVITVYPGAAPDEVLEQVTRPVEQALRNLEGVKHVYSQSMNNLSVVQLEYGHHDDMKRRQEEVRRALEGVALPEDAQKPEVKHYSTTGQPVMHTSVSGAEGVSEKELSDIVTRELLPKLEAVEGVSNVQVIGLEDSSAWYVRLDGAKMAEYGFTYDQLASLIQAGNVSIPLGQTVMGEEILPVFVQGDLRSVEQLEDLSLVPDGSVRLRDVAVITQGKETGVISLTNGKPSITLNIVKSSAANTVEVADKVLRIYEEAEKSGKIRTFIMYNRASDVKESVHSLAQEGLLGALFASLVILFFLRNVRATLIAVVSIPLSMLMALIGLMEGEAYGHLAEWFIAFKPETDLDRFIEEIRPRAMPPEGSRFSLVKDDMTGGGAVEITVTASSREQLRLAAERVVKTLEGIEGIADVCKTARTGLRLKSARRTRSATV